MHLSRLLKTDDFAFSSAGRTLGFDDVFPGFGREDRVGIVTRSPGSAHRAAGLLLAAVARFYETRLAERDDFYAYPDFYVFHVGELRGYHGRIDVWPEHKEVLVRADPESIVTAVNDRGITRLLVEDAPPAAGLMSRETVEGLRDRLKSAYAFGPGSEPARPDTLLVSSPEPATATLLRSIEASRSFLAEETAHELRDQATRPQGFRSLSTDEIIGVLSGYGPSDPDLGMSPEYYDALELTQAVMGRHRFPV